MTLQWKGQQPGNITAAGNGGTLFNIQSLASQQHVLQGCGPDGLPLLSLPPLGHAFVDIDDAKRMAEDINHRQPEGEASGT